MMSSSNTEDLSTAGGPVLTEQLPLAEENAGRVTTARTFSLDDVDVREQQRLHAQLASNLDLAFERAVEEAIRRSLQLSGESFPESTMENDDLVARGAGHPNGIVGDLNAMRLDDVSVDSEQPAAASSLHSPSDPDFHNGCNAFGQNNDSDADDEEEAAPRSRRSQFRHSQSERSERRPSLDRIHNHQSERRPSLERIYQVHGALSAEDNRERRPSLERVYQHRTQDQHERRPSLERLGAYRSERRPSLERLEKQRSERRPSLERLEQCGIERRPSLERKRRAEASSRLQSLQNGESVEGSGQGINTLRPWPLNHMGVPTNWDLAQMQELDPYTDYCLVPLSPVDREYNAITVDFEEAGLRVIKVERLQNHYLLDRFKREKEHLLQTRPSDFELNERYLYHGTQADRLRLCEEGLDARLSFQGCFGRGIYFSDNPRKCMQYANVCRAQGDEHAMIVVCRVILGESKCYSPGDKDPGLKREPEKPSARGGWRFYDSVQGTPVDYPEFVVYENRRAMIEYIISFEEKAYRAPPPLRTNSNQTPSLYKVDPEPIELPIPEEELDKLYMLGPDTDSEGSCDEHTREVERLRDNVRRGKAKRLGIPYRPPTELYDMMIRKKQEEKEARKKRKQLAKGKKTKSRTGTADGATGGTSPTEETTGDLESGAVALAPSDPADDEVENESVAAVLSNLIADFLEITQTDDVVAARRYINDSGMDLDKALCQYFNEN
ncbi:hypothetical protein BaRGS_00007978 [Batillaria attramentaria]|uniref:Poly [ADP-ribose] polymerase n=1 Tax=Batillaria attramentaria TaxID=370345 RepID=A0ABD0LMB3_9CAEN